jgi:hypothetical protein
LDNGVAVDNDISVFATYKTFEASQLYGKIAAVL